jgi:hypothetical protein
MVAAVLNLSCTVAIDNRGQSSDLRFGWSGLYLWFTSFTSLKANPATTKQLEEL